MHAKRNSTGDKELGFWGYENVEDHFSFNTELEFKAEALAGDGFGYSSPPLWKSYRSRSASRESSPLLPRNHHYSNLSPVSRRLAIVDGRRELMGMIENMAESSYELSLKDIVDAPQSFHENEAASRVIKATKHEMNGGGKVKRGTLARTASMESEAFLIKMFFPTSLGSKKKVKPGNSARVSSLRSPDRHGNSKERVWWVKCFPVTGKSRSISRSSTSGSSDNSSRR